MSLEDEIAIKARETYRDGLDMSIGEIYNMYLNGEIIINPKFQRLFRWEDWQKTQFIESLLLGMAIPPIFVYSTGKGKWELIDGLQRLSTIFQFMGCLKDDKGSLFPPLQLEGTKLLPQLQDMSWNPKTEDDENYISEDLKFDFKRTKLRIEILKKESDPNAKYLLFQRMNSGVSPLSAQEIRKCSIIMINEKFYNFIEELSGQGDFSALASVGEAKEKEQYIEELVIRFLALYCGNYSGKQDVHEFLDDTAVELASDPAFNYAHVKEIFKTSFSLIHSGLGTNAFRRFSDGRFVGQFALSSFEVISLGVSKNLGRILQLPDPGQFIRERHERLWGDDEFKQVAKAGVRGTTRLSKNQAIATRIFMP
jgi:hypothetical protein